MAYPIIAAAAASATPADSTSHVCALPSGIAAGDMLIVIAVCDGNTAMTWPSGWTAITNAAGAAGAAVRSEARYRIADGSEGASITVTGGNEAWVSRTWRLTGHAGTAPLCAATTGATADAAIPDLFPSWQAQGTLYLLHVGWDTRPAFTFWPAPQGTAGARLFEHVSDAGASAGSVKQASLGLSIGNTGILDRPGPFRSEAAAWRTLVIAVQPDTTIPDPGAGVAFAVSP